MHQTWFMGVGISLSFLAGEQPRAPAALQRLGLEWMHRLWHEPRRLFGRYIVHDLPFGLRLLGWALAQRLLPVRGPRGVAPWANNRPQRSEIARKGDLQIDGSWSSSIARTPRELAEPTRYLLRTQRAEEDVMARRAFGARHSWAARTEEIRRLLGFWTEASARGPAEEVQPQKSRPSWNVLST